MRAYYFGQIGSERKEEDFFLSFFLQIYVGFWLAKDVIFPSNGQEADEEEDGRSSQAQFVKIRVRPDISTCIRGSGG